MAIFTKYIDKQTKEYVSAFKYEDVRDFAKLQELIGDAYPTLTPAHTRIYENKWVIRYNDGRVRFMQCPSGDLCFHKRFEKYK